MCLAEVVYHYGDASRYGGTEKVNAQKCHPVSGWDRPFNVPVISPYKSIHG